MAERDGNRMDERVPSTQVMKASQARAGWSQLLDTVSRRQTRVLVEKGGIPVAAIVSAEDLERLARLDAERYDRFAAIKAIRARNVDRDPEQAARDVAEEIAALRAERAHSQ